MTIAAEATAALVAEAFLIEAYEFVREGWCQGARALDEYGREIEPSSVFARKWSAPGAIERAWQRSAHEARLVIDGYQLANLALASVVRAVPQEWNDEEERRQSEVLDVLAEASVAVEHGRARGASPPLVP